MRPSSKQMRHGYRKVNALARIRSVTADHARLLTMFATVAMVLAARGCATPQRVHDPSVRFVRVAMHPADDAVRAHDVFTAAADSRRFESLKGDEPGDVVLFTSQPTDEHGASWASLEGDARIEYWTFDDQGNVLLTAVLDEADRAISLFEPPLTFPRELPPGQPFREQTSMRVVDSRNPSVVKATGTAVRSIEYIDNQLIRTPAGEMIAQRVVVHFKADMSMATAETSSTYYVVPGKGIVAEQATEQVKILGVFGRSDDRTLVLVDG